MSSTKRGQLEMKFKTWGGKRSGAGRPQAHHRCSEPHREREDFAARFPVHVTLRVEDGLGSLRCAGGYEAIRAAMQAVHERADFRIVHASIQRDHLHLVNEASGKTPLAKGIQALQISVAHHLKKHLLRECGIRHTGTVFIDRYHAEIIDTPTQAHHALGYVLLNWRKHGEDRDRPWLLDPYSTAISFTNWNEQPERWAIPDGYQPLPVHAPHTWLLREGWKLAGSLSMFSRPGPRPKSRS